jgi:hypothetical protein
MKVWVLESVSSLGSGLYWTGEATIYANSVDHAVQFVRAHDAQRVLADNLLLNARVVEVELPDGDEPRAQSGATHHGDGGTVNS